MDEIQAETDRSYEALRAQTAATKAKIAKAMKGSNNPAYDRGQRSYREKVHAPPGKVVHHKDGNRANNAKSNLEIISKAKNDKIHHREDNFKKSGGLINHTLENRNI